MQLCYNLESAILKSSYWCLIDRPDQCLTYICSYYLLELLYGFFPFFPKFWVVDQVTRTIVLGHLYCCKFTRRYLKAGVLSFNLSLYTLNLYNFIVLKDTGLYIRFRQMAMSFYNFNTFYIQNGTTQHVGND